MSENLISLRYARALYELAEAQNNVEDVHASLQNIADLINQIASLNEFLINPLLDVRERNQVLKALFSTRVPPLVYKFLLFISEKGRLNYLNSVIESFDNVYLSKHNQLRANIQTALPLDEKLREEIRQQLKKKYGKEIAADWQIRKDLLGGFRVLIEGNLHDYSFTSQLERFKQNVLQ